MTHVFIDDNTDWLDRIRRCGYITGDFIYGGVCSLPAGNRIHLVPAVSDEASRTEARRLGERGSE